ncbi:MAG: hypothetical protein M1277_00635 [Patescibacteria group bacterium]|nr:hypothetical protein [Patescibacteria group bacterium]
MVEKYVPKPKNKNEKNSKRKRYRLLIGEALGKKAFNSPVNLLLWGKYARSLALKIKNKVKTRVSKTNRRFNKLFLDSKNTAGIDKTKQLITMSSISTSIDSQSSFLESPLSPNKYDRERKDQIFPGVYLLSSDTDHK